MAHAHVHILTHCHISVFAMNSHMADRHDPSSSWPSSSCSAVLVEEEREKEKHSPRDQIEGE